MGMQLTEENYYSDIANYAGSVPERVRNLIE